MNLIPLILGALLALAPAGLAQVDHRPAQSARSVSFVNDEAAYFA